MKRFILFPLTGFGLALAVFVLLLASNLYTYHRLTSEAPIAELRFRQLAPFEFEATLAWGDFCSERKFVLYGDQWRLDAQFLKWRPWANLLGLDALYRIERLGGRYADTGLENSQAHLAHALHAADGPDLPALLARHDSVISPVDTLYGSSVYAAMDPGQLYRVYRGQSGLLVRQEPLLGAAAGSSGLTIAINKACGEEAGWLERLLHRQ
jgi:hypothetical protein